MSDTPRTDKVAETVANVYGGGTVVPVEFARQLERELAYAISRSHEEIDADRAMTRATALAELRSPEVTAIYCPNCELKYRCPSCDRAVDYDKPQLGQGK